MEGSGGTLDVSGVDNNVNLTGTQSVSVSGANNSVGNAGTDTNVTFSADGNWIQVTGSHNTTTFTGNYGTVYDNLSNGTLNIAAGADATLNGDGDSVNVTGASEHTRRISITCEQVQKQFQPMSYRPKSKTRPIRLLQTLSINFSSEERPLIPRRILQRRGQTLFLPLTPAFRMCCRLEISMPLAPPPKSSIRSLPPRGQTTSHRGLEQFYLLTWA